MVQGLVALAVLAGMTRPAWGQRVLGPSTDATVIPRGMIRVSISPTWERSHQRYADGLGRNGKGKVESLTEDFNLDTLGLRQFPTLAPVNAGLRSILGGTGPLPLTLGSLSARFDRTVATTPITIEYGLVRRLMVGLVIPMVKTRTEISLNPNPGATNSTVGVNTSYLGGTAATAARNRNQQVVLQLAAAGQALQALLQTCQGSTTAACGPVNADRAAAQALVAAAAAAATGIESVYGISAAKPGSPYAPTQNGSLHKSVEARLGNMSNSFLGFLGAPTSGAKWVEESLSGARALAYGDFQKALIDTAFGVRADSMVSVELSRPGDIEFGAKLLVFDAFGFDAAQRGTPGGIRTRLSLGAAYRLGSGLRDSVDHFADVGTGDGQTDIEGRAFLDVLFGRRFWASAVARYTMQQADEIVRRVPSVAHDPFPGATSRLLVSRDLGDVMSLEVSPRYVVSESFAIGGTWRYLKKSADTYAFVTAPNLVTPPASNLALGTEQSEQRAVVSMTYSNLAQYFRGRARSPMEVSFTVGRTLSGSGNITRSTISGLTLRVYNQLF